MEFLWIQRNDEEVMAGLEPIGFTKKDFEEGGEFNRGNKKTGIEIK